MQWLSWSGEEGQGGEEVERRDGDVRSGMETPEGRSLVERTELNGCQKTWALMAYAGARGGTRIALRWGGGAQCNLQKHQMGRWVIRGLDDRKPKNFSFCKIGIIALLLFWKFHWKSVTQGRLINSRKAIQIYLPCIYESLWNEDTKIQGKLSILVLRFNKVRTAM